MSTWRPTRPNSSDDIADIPSLTQDNFSAIEAVLGVEHYTITHALSGLHKGGIAGGMFVGTTAQIAALSNPPTGAMAQDTDLGVVVEYRGGALGWDKIGQSEWSRSAAYPTTAVAVTADEPPYTIIWDTEIYNTLSEMNTADGVFTAKASAGSYTIVVSLGLVASGTQVVEGYALPVGDYAVTWSRVTTGATYNYETVDDYPGADDADYNAAWTEGREDEFYVGSLEDSWTTGEDSYYSLKLNAANHAGAQGFMLSANSVINHVELSLDKQSPGAAQNTKVVWAEIWYGDPSTDVPSGDSTNYIARSSSATFQTIPTAGPTWINFYFNPPVILSADTEYHIVAQADYGSSLTEYIRWAKDTSIAESGNGGGSIANDSWVWTCEADDTNTLFKIYTQPYIPAGSTGIKVMTHYRARAQGTTEATIDSFIVTPNGKSYGITEELTTGPFVDYEWEWDYDPETNELWTPSGAMQILRYGYDLCNESPTSASSANISQMYLEWTWNPPRPIVTIGLYKDDVLFEASKTPLFEAGEASYQTAQLFSTARLTAGQDLRVKVDKTLVDDEIVVDSKYTWISIHRVSGAVL